jgi:prepilin-type processing-associated H-X9-DG protein
LEELDMLRKRFSRRAAFTLIEVMVVTGIMMSQANNYGDVKKIAYQKSCENNLRQLYMALQMEDTLSGGLPDARFYTENPKKDPKSLYNVLGPNYQQSLVCPVFPSSVKDKGCTYLYNDTLAGQSLDSIQDPRKTWLLTELNAVSPKIAVPHLRGFHILYADGHTEITDKIPPDLAELAKKAEEQQNDKKPGEGEKKAPSKPAAPAMPKSPLDRARGLGGTPSSAAGE